MNSLKFLYSLATAVILFSGCSFVDTLMKKMDYKNKKENTVQQVKKPSYDDDIKFYNEYTVSVNKLREAGEAVYKDFLRDIPEPGNVSKNSLIISVAFTLSTESLERTLKEYKRSFFDSGNLSRLKASETMKTEIGDSFRNLLNAMDEYYIVSQKVSEYYSRSEFKSDLSKVKIFNEQIKTAYENYSREVKSMTATLKKYKPKREARDPSAITDPDERASELMINSYGEILDAAEDFYDSFSELRYKGNKEAANGKFEEFLRVLDSNKRVIMSGEFTDKTKFMKYNFEDYFSKTANKFTETGKIFFNDFTEYKSENIFNNKYNDVIQNYNYMVQSYNTSINSINSVRQYR